MLGGGGGCGPPQPVIWFRNELSVDAAMVADDSAKNGFPPARPANISVPSQSFCRIAKWNILAFLAGGLQNRRWCSPWTGSPPKDRPPLVVTRAPSVAGAPAGGVSQPESRDVPRDVGLKAYGQPAKAGGETRHRPVGGSVRGPAGSPPGPLSDPLLTFLQSMMVPSAEAPGCTFD